MNVATHLWMFLLLTALLLPLRGTAQPLCSTAELSRNCDFFKEKKSEAYISLEDGSYFTNPLFEGTSKPTPPAKRLPRERIDELFRFARENLLEEIAKGRSYQSLTADEKSQFRKIETLTKFKLGKSSEHDSCKSDGPNASYVPSDHTMIICESFLNEPSSLIVQTLAHELAHAIDPCHQRLPLLKKNIAKLLALPKSEDEWPDEIRKNPDSRRTLSRLRAQPAHEYSNFTNVTSLENPKVLEELEKQGWFEVAAPPVPANRNPNLATYNCLKAIPGIREVSNQDIADLARQYTDTVDNGMKPVDRYAIDSAVRKNMRDYQQCMPSFKGFSQMQEAMSNAWAAKVLGRWLALHPPKNETEKLAAISLELREICTPEKLGAKAATNLVKPARIAAGEAVRNSEIHPAGRITNDSITLSDPRIQNALQCKPMPNQTCTRSLGTLGPINKTEETSASSAPKKITN